MDVRIADCGRLVAALATAPAGRVTVTVRRADSLRHRGHSIVLPEEAVAEIRAGGVNPGRRGFLEIHPEGLFPVDMVSDGHFVDLDPPEAYAAEPAQVAA